jgi:type IV secretory pathway VirB2 component (pilin)
MNMEKIIETLGNVVAVAGVLICVVAGVLRVTGNFYLLGYETMTLFVGGMGLMLMGCLAKLQKL